MFEIIGLFAAIVGFFLSYTIYQKKQTKKPLICPLNGRCDLVLHSRFSTTLGVRNELLGMAYYLLIWVLYATKLLVPEIATGGYMLFLAVLSTMGVLFSIYLTAIQGLVLKSWCTWCIFSALMNLTLFALLFNIDIHGAFTVLGIAKTPILIIHTIGFVLGVGAATIADIFFFRFLQDHKITEEEKGTLDMLTSVIWVGLTILVVSGFGLYFPDMVRLNESPKFLLKAIVVGVIALNGFLLNWKVGPYVTQLSFDKAPAPTRLRRLAFALGAISITSWYLAFVLGSLKTIAVNFKTGLLLYVALLFCAIVGSQLFERTVVKKMNAEKIK